MTSPLKPSLRAKMTLYLPLTTCFVLAVILYAILHYFERTIKETVADQQNFTVTVLAEDLDRKFETTHNLLIEAARKVNASHLESPEKARAFLQERSEYTKIFDDGLFLFDREGNIVAALPFNLARLSTDYSFSKQIKKTIETKAPHISDPYLPPQGDRNPNMMFTAPVYDASRKVAGVLVGSIDLVQAGFIGSLISHKIGNTGYMYMFNKDRVMVYHPDPGRIMKKDIPLGANPLYDKAIKGFNGTDETVNSKGEEILASFRHLKTNNLILSANYPTEEAYESLRRLQKYFAMGIIPAMLAIFLIMRQLLGKITEPLTQFTRHVENLNNKTGKDRLYPESSVGEVDTLGTAFNNLITQIDKSHEEIEKREQIYRTVVEFSSDLSFWLAPESREIRYITPSCLQITGYKDEEFYQDAALLDRIIHPNYREIWAQHKAVEGSCECLEPLEIALQTHDGSIVWVNHICRPVYDSAGNFCGIRGSFDDVTQIKQGALAVQASEEALHRQNDYLIALQETTMDIVGRLELHSLLSAIITRAAKLMNTEHGFIYLLNEAKTEMVLQIKLGHYKTLPVPPLKKGQGLAGHVWELAQPFTISDYSSWEKGLKEPGYEQIKATAGIPLISAGEVVGVIGLGYLDSHHYFDRNELDILQRFAALASLALENAHLYQSAQQALQDRINAEASLHKLSYAVKQSPVSIMITDLEGRIEYANPHLLEVTGYNLEELIGQKANIFKSEFTKPAEYKKLWETIMSGNVWHGEFHNRKKNGDLYWELAQISPIKDNMHNITNFLAVKEDLDDRKALEDQLRHSQKMEAVGQLAGGIAHDFNNILTAIIGYASIMQLKLPVDSPFKDTAKQILSAAERGSSLTQGLLAYSRKQEMNPAKVDLNDIITRSKKLLLRLVGEDIQIQSVQGGQPLMIMADSIQIEQVLMNLITNARDAMPDGGTISITTETVNIDAQFIVDNGFGVVGTFAHLSICDTGEGMDEETLKRIFDPFYTTKETGKGTGLGLSIVYGIIKRHGGYINCRSELGKGSCISMYLPLIVEQQTENNAVKEEKEPAGGTELILMAEDDESMRGLYRELLEEFGYTVIEAIDGLDALNKFNEHASDIRLVILDAVMPGMKGLDVYRAIRKEKPDTKVLFCSGYSIDIIEKELKKDPLLQFLGKPYMPKELLMKIREILGNDQ